MRTSLFADPPCRLGREVVAGRAPARPFHATAGTVFRLEGHRALAVIAGQAGGRGVRNPLARDLEHLQTIHWLCDWLGFRAVTVAVAARVDPTLVTA